jgi:hypothetical protein
VTILVICHRGILLRDVISVELDECYDDIQDDTTDWTTTINNNNKKISKTDEEEAANNTNSMNF